MSTLVIKFDSLSNQIEGLLTLFEDSAKSVAQKEINLELKGDTEKQEEVLEKLKLLLDQNKLIAKGITLVHENSSPPKDTVLAQTAPRGFTPAPITAPTTAPATIEHDEPELEVPQQNVFSMSKNTSGAPEPKAMEEEGNLPPKPSFSI